MSASTMANTVLAALSGDVERKAAAALASARERHGKACSEHAALAAEHAAARDTFEASGTDADASKLQRLAMRFERAERIRTAAAVEVAQAERDVGSAGLEVVARRALDAEQDARAKHAAELDALHDATTTLLVAMVDLTRSFAATTAAEGTASQARARAADAVAAVADADPSRAMPLAEELRRRTNAAASRSWARSRIEFVARLVAAARKLADNAIVYLDGLVSEQVSAARSVGMLPLVPGAVDAAVELAAIEAPTAGQLRRAIAIVQGDLHAPRPRAITSAAELLGVQTFPHTSGLRMSESEKVEAARVGLAIVWEHGALGAEPEAAWKAWLERTRGARDARAEAENMAVRRAVEEGFKREQARRISHAMVNVTGQYVGGLHAPAAPHGNLVSIEHAGESVSMVITPTGELVPPPAA